MAQESSITQPIPSIFPVLLVNFIGMLGYSIIIPLLVYLVKAFGGNEFIYGILGSIYPAFQLVGAPILGKLSDRVGRKRVLLVSQIGTFFAWTLFIIALILPAAPIMEISNSVAGTFFISFPLILLFLARAFDGLTGGNISVANAYLSDVSTDANRKANFGKMASSSSLGFVLGPTIAGVLGATILGTLAPVLAAAVVSLVAIFVIWRFLPESKPELLKEPINLGAVRKIFHIEQKECYETEDCEANRLQGMLRIPNIPILYLLYFLTFLGFSFFYAGFPLFAANQMEWTPIQLGMYFTILSSVMILVQGPILSFLSDKVSDGVLVIIGSLILGCSFFCFPIGTMTSVYTGNVLYALGNGLMWPSFLSILSAQGAQNQKGTIQGYANSMGSLASIFGLVLGGFLFGVFKANVFYLSGCLFMIIFLLSIWMVTRSD